VEVSLRRRMCGIQGRRQHRLSLGHLSDSPPGLIEQVCLHHYGGPTHMERPARALHSSTAHGAEEVGLRLDRGSRGPFRKVEERAQRP